MEETTTTPQENEENKVKFLGRLTLDKSQVQQAVAQFALTNEDVKTMVDGKNVTGNFRWLTEQSFLEVDLLEVEETLDSPPDESVAEVVTTVPAPQPAKTSNKKKAKKRAKK